MPRTELEHRWIEEDGTVICQQPAMVELLYSGQALGGIFCDDPEDANEWATATSLCDSSMVGPAAVQGPQFGGISWGDHWNTPAPYDTIDVGSLCIQRCTSDAERARIHDEMIQLEARGMIPVLRHLVYCVDTWRAAGIFWGVGRGSSVSSLVLHKIGINRINPMDFDLEISEWLK